MSIRTTDPGFPLPIVRPSIETRGYVHMVVEARMTSEAANISSTVNARSSTASPRRRAASIVAPRVTPGRMRGPLGAVRSTPSRR